MTADELLEAAKVAMYQGRQKYRDSRLEVGRLLHRYTLEFLRAVDHLPEHKRLAEGTTRPEAMKRAADALQTNTGQINRFISVAMAVDLLGGGEGAGMMGYGALILFTRFVRRKSRTTRKEIPGRNGVPASAVEEWEIKAAFSPKAERLFQDAVRLNMTYEQIRPAVLKLYTGPHAPRECKHRRRAAPGEQSATDTLKTCAAIASPGDVVEMCMDLVEASADPYVVAQKLITELGRVKKRKAVPA